MKTHNEQAAPRADMNSGTPDYHGGHASNTVPDLVSTLAGDISNLITTEMALARAEMQEAANDAKRGVSGMALGGCLAFAGVIVLLMSAVYALGLEIPLWSAALFTGAIATGAGITLLKSGQARVEPKAFVPERTKSSLEKDKTVAKRRMS